MGEAQLKTILSQLKKYNGKLVAVSKTKPPEAIQKLYDHGQRIFGENKVQELVDKEQKLPQDIEWHFIGHLQSNKVKYIAPFVSCIHSVESLKLLKEINKQAAKQNRTIDCLLQLKIAKEDSKFGLNINSANAILESEDFTALENVKICGVMGMATFTEDKTIVKTEFKTLHSHFQTLKSAYFTDSDSFKEISMGMSGDYLLALEEGSTMVRIGSLLFGSRT